MEINEKHCVYALRIISMNVIFRYIIFHLFLVQG